MRTFFRVLPLTIIMLCGFSLLSYAQNGLAFDGADDYVQTTFTGPTGKLARTIECWVKPPLVTKGTKMFFDYGSNSNGGGFGLGMTEGYLSAHVGGFSVTTKGLVADEEWHHVAFLYDSLENYNFRVYLDGEIIDSFNATVSINTRSNTKLLLGKGLVSGTNFSGVIDELRIWNYAQKFYTLNNNSKSEFCTLPKGLLAYYKMNEGLAEGNNLKVKTAYDYGPGKKNGTLYNFYLDKNVSNWVKGNKFQVGYVSSYIADTACNTYTSPSGKFKWTKSGTYTDTIPNFMGCDSAITIALKVYPIPQKSITVKACEAYTSPSGKYVWTTSGTYGDKLKNPKGCDTNVTIKLTIYNGSINSINVKACSNYTSPSGKYTWYKSGDYVDTIQTVNGCDSILNIKLVLLNSSSIQKVKTCGSFVSPSGKYTWSQSGFYYDVVKNYRACDSVIGIDLTILEPSLSKIEIIDCGNYISPSGKYSYNVSGIFYDTLTNFAGCDSIIEVSLTIIEPASYLNIQTCDKMVSPSKKYIWTKTGSYLDTVQTAKGCDSIITVDLKVLTSSTGHMDLSACKSYVSPSGKHIWTKTGVYSDTVLNNQKCDSVLSINLTIKEVETSVLQKGNTLTAVAKLAEYQWIDCKDGNRISGENKQTFNPENDGVYAVIITIDDCSDTSDCFIMENVGINDNITLAKSKVYPNPTNDVIYINFTRIIAQGNIQVCDVSGKVLFQKSIDNEDMKIINLQEYNGVFVLVISSEFGVEKHRVIKLN